MTKLVERITIDIERCDDALYGKSEIPWEAIVRLVEGPKGKWHVTAEGLSCHVTALGLEEVPEENGGDN